MEPANDQRPSGAPPAPVRRELTAYRVSNWPPYKLIPAPVERRWMDETQQRFAYRCLPLLVANQSGWVLLNQIPFKAMWTGGWDFTSVKIAEMEEGQKPPASSHFGSGVLTFHIPWLFRTPPGWNLWARGPANHVKEAVQPLDGVIETDWAIATFTMNWRFSSKNVWTTFEKDEPICQLVPVRRGELEEFDPVERDITEDPALSAAFDEWKDSRKQFISDLHEPGSAARAAKWERHYFRGITRDGTPAPQHQTKLDLAELKRLDDNNNPSP